MAVLIVNVSDGEVLVCCNTQFKEPHNIDSEKLIIEHLCSRMACIIYFNLSHIKLRVCKFDFKNYYSKIFTSCFKR